MGKCDSFNSLIQELKLHRFGKDFLYYQLTVVNMHVHQIKLQLMIKNILSSHASVE